MLIFKLMLIAGMAALVMLTVFYMLESLFRSTTKPVEMAARSSARESSRSSVGAASTGLLGAGALASTSFLDDDSDDSSALSVGSSLLDDDDFTASSTSMFDDCSGINPANGLPMMGCIDIEGNAYGTDSSHDDLFASSSTSLFDDSLSSSIFDDTFSSSFDVSFSSSSMFDD